MTDEKNELIRKIVQVCATCPKFKDNASCQSRCHYKQVKKWLKRLKEIEEVNSADS